MVDAYFDYFGTKPKTLCHRTLEPNDYPEIYGSPIIDQDGVQQF